MAARALIVRGKLSAFAAAAGDTILLGKLKIAFYKLYYVKDIKAIANAQIIYDAANDLTPAQRIAAGISDSNITDLFDSITTFKTLPSPDQMRAIKKQLTADLALLFKKSKAILKDSLDGLMYQFHGSEFYAQYNNVRPLHESHRHTVLTAVAVDEEGKDLADVQVLFTSDANNFEDMTDEQGIVKQQISPDKDYKVKFVLPDF